MSLTRRQFAFQTAAAAAWLTARKRLRAALSDPAILGANTAISGYDLFQAIDLIRELGFPAIEIHPMGMPQATPGRFPGFQFDRLSGGEKAKIKAALGGFQHVTGHLPYTDLHYVSLFGPVAEFSIRQIDIALEGIAYFGGKVAVLHPESPNGRALEEAWDDLVKAARRWGDLGQRYGIKLALETGFPRSIKDYVRLIQAIDHDAVGSTIDVGHQKSYAELLARVKPEERATPEGIRAYNDTTIEIIDKLGPKIFHLHIHDIDPQTWQEHTPLVHGFVDYPRLFRKLQQIDYAGLLIFEIGGEAEKMKGYLADGKQKIEKYLSEL